MSKETLEQKRSKQLWYKLGKNKEKFPKVIYFILECFALIWEMIKGLLRFISGFLVTCIIFFIVCISVGCILVKPVLTEYVSDTKEILYGLNETDFKIKAGEHYIEYKDIPTDIITNIVFLEDNSFWRNKGVDIKGLYDSGLLLLKSKGTESKTVYPLAQQLARIMFLDNTVGIERKVKEVIIGIDLEKTYDKEVLMEYYCNNLYFANDIYGIENASYFYFNESVDNLTLKEKMFLCVIATNPENYNPLRNYKKTVLQSELFIDNLFEQGLLDLESYDTAKKETIIIRR